MKREPSRETIRPFEKRQVPDCDLVPSHERGWDKAASARAASARAVSEATKEAEQADSERIARLEASHLDHPFGRLTLTSAQAVQKHYYDCLCALCRDE